MTQQKFDNAKDEAIIKAADLKQQQDDLDCLQRIKALLKKEGFTGGKILAAVNEQIEYVKKGGVL